MRTRRWLAVAALIGLAGCALPPNDGTGGFTRNTAQQKFMDAECVATGHITNDGASTTVSGMLLIDCVPTPKVWHVIITLQWSARHVERGHPRIWYDVGGSQESTVPPDDTGEIYRDFSAPCTPGRWRMVIEASGTLADDSPASAIVYQPHPPARIKNCHANY